MGIMITGLVSVTAGRSELAGVDSGFPGVDSGAPGVDSGTPGVDSGTPGVDSGTPGVDSGTPGVDSGTLGVDSEGSKGVLSLFSPEDADDCISEEKLSSFEEDPLTTLDVATTDELSV